MHIELVQTENQLAFLRKMEALAPEPFLYLLSGDDKTSIEDSEALHDLLDRGLVSKSFGGSGYVIALTRAGTDLLSEGLPASIEPLSLVDAIAMLDKLDAYVLSEASDYGFGDYYIHEADARSANETGVEHGVEATIKWTKQLLARVV